MIATLAPITKKPSAGSTAKLGTGSIGKSTSTIGKNYNLGSSGKGTVMMGSSGKSKNLLGSSGKSNVFMGASGKKDTTLASSGKSINVFSSSGKSSSHETAKAGSMYGTSAKTTSLFGSSGKNASLYGGDKNKATVSSDKSSKALITPKNTTVLGSDEKNNRPTNFSGKNTDSPTREYPSYISSKANKPTTSFGIIWIPTRKNKKKDLVFNSHNYERYKEKSPSMYSYTDSRTSSQVCWPSCLGCCWCSPAPCAPETRCACE